MASEQKLMSDLVLSHRHLSKNCIVYQFVKPVISTYGFSKPITNTALEEKNRESVTSKHEMAMHGICEYTIINGLANIRIVQIETVVDSVRLCLNICNSSDEESNYWLARVFNEREHGSKYPPNTIINIVAGL